MKYISKTVWILSVVSLLTDVASEMLYPIMPIYLKSIGFSIVLIGILEGVAEATAGISKSYFGKLSDNSGKRVPFVKIGYALSSISKPMMAVFVFPLWVFFARTIDRFGKGIRTGARDAIISQEATSSTKARVFGFHRSMDTIGAVLGPVLALVFLYYYPGNYKTLFIIAFFPGLIAIFLTFKLKDKELVPKQNRTASFFSIFSYWKQSTTEYRKLLIGLLAFALINSSDIFLLLKAKESGIDDLTLIQVYIFYNLIYALSSYPIGILADKVGLKKIFLFGLLLFAGVYFGMSFNSNSVVFFGLFLIYGVYAAATEGIAKAWISNVSDSKDTATAIGTYSGLQSICTMIASSATGIIWYAFGSSVALSIIAILTMVILVYFYFAVPKTNKVKSEK
ncbi:MAG: MFS transporter [Bacteroidia bacterium]|nr:MFS transporter [Bacteroidia bacterium]